MEQLKRSPMSVVVASLVSLCMFSTHAFATVVIPDESGNGLDATFDGAPGFAPECAGQALQVDGSVNYGTVQPTPSQVVQALTVEGYVRWSGNTNGESLGRGIIDKVTQHTDAGRSWAIGIIKGSRQLNAVVWFNGSNGRVDVVDPDPLPDPMSGCVQVALTVSADGEVRLYRNGQLKATESFANKSINYAINTHIGFANSQNGTAPLNGSLDMFRISNIVRTEFPNSPVSLGVDQYTIGLWRFGADPSSVSGYVRDAQGNGIAGVQVNKGCDVGGYTTTDASGYWIVNNIAAGSCTFTPQKAGCTFTPASQTIGGSATNVDFVADCAAVVIPDESGHGLDATFEGSPVFAPECVGQALQVDGNVNYGTVQPTASQVVQALTIEGYVRWSGNTNGASLGRGIIDKATQHVDAGRSWAIGILKGSRQLNAVVWFNDSNGRVDVVDPDPLPDPMSGCVQVALTVSENGEVRLYRDGQLKATQSFAGKSINYAINTEIGFANSQNGTAPLNGSLDMFRISNIVRTEFPSSPTDLSVDEYTIGLWRFAFSVSGYVRDALGHGVAGVQVNKGCDVGGNTMTDANGYWIVNNIAAGSCTYTPEKPGCTFTPASRTIGGSAGNVNFTVITCPISAVEDRTAAGPLLNAYPNPLMGSVHLSLDHVPPGRIRIDVCDVAGRHVRTLLEEERADGPVAVTWNADNSRGEKVPTGMYYAVFTSPSSRIVKKLLVIK